jgi:hypothetical protein
MNRPSVVCLAHKRGSILSCICKKRKEKFFALSHWNHRIFKDKNGYSIRETYYGKKEELSWTENPNDMTGETLEDLKDYYDQMKEAFDAPVIDVDNPL